MTEEAKLETLGRYLLCEPLGSGGMATVHLGRLSAATGFSRAVAIKRLHPHLAKDPLFVTMLLDEARLAARIHHPNVVSTTDVIDEDGELALVMDFVEGVSLAALLNELVPRRVRIPLPIVGAIFSGVLQGLHAAHEARDERGAPLELVHRDISPHNVLVGVDGVARVLDFGVAKAAGRLNAATASGQMKGTFAYMSPEQAGSKPIDRRSDVYSASVILWECLTGTRLFGGQDAGAILSSVLFAELEPPSKIVPELGADVDAMVMRGLARDPGARWPTAIEFAGAVEKTLGVASAIDVATYLKAEAAPLLASRAEALARVERWDVTTSRRKQQDAVMRVASDTSGERPAVEAPSVDVTAASRSDAEAHPSRFALFAGVFVTVAVVVFAGVSWIHSVSSPTPTPTQATDSGPAAAGSASAPDATVHDAAPSITSAVTSDAASAPASAAPHATARAPLPLSPHVNVTPSSSSEHDVPSTTDDGGLPHHRRPGAIPDSRK